MSLISIRNEVTGNPAEKRTIIRTILISTVMTGLRRGKTQIVETSGGHVLSIHSSINARQMATASKQLSSSAPRKFGG